MTNYAKLIFLISLGSIFTSCLPTSKKQDNKQLIPQFPQTDNPTCTVQVVLYDTLFNAQSFIIVPDKRHVFCLSYTILQDDKAVDYSLHRINSEGVIDETITLNNFNWTRYACFAWEDDGKLRLFLNDESILSDPLNLKDIRRDKIYHFENFLSQNEKMKLVFDEQRDAYTSQLKNALDKSLKTIVRRLPKLGVLELNDSNNQQAYWHIRDEEDLSYYIKKFGEHKAEGVVVNDSIDAEASIRHSSHQILDYKMAYPDLEYIEENVFELIYKNQRARFKCTNKEKLPLEFSMADNNYLLTTGGSIWILYNAQLFRIYFQ